MLEGPIVVPLDGSALAELALPLAIEIARQTGASIHVVRVPASLDESASRAPRGAPAVERAAWLYLGEVVHELEGTLGRGRASLAVLPPPIGPALTAYARAEQAMLLVMTTNGASGCAPRLGTVPEYLAGRLAVPLVLVRPREQARERVRWRCRRIVLPVDGVDAASASLAFAEELGALFGGELAPFHADVSALAGDASARRVLELAARERADLIVLSIPEAGARAGDGLGRLPRSLAERSGTPLALVPEARPATSREMDRPGQAATRLDLART